MKRTQSLFSKLMWKLLSLTITAILILGFVYLYLEIQLPNVDALKDPQLQVPLRVYTNDGKLIAEYGEMRRSPIPLDKIPKQLIDAVLATEDQRFFEHSGVDPIGLMRAAIHLALTGTKTQGASTITMQVARNFYLTSQKTFTRKINEILLAIKIDREFSKQKILELYLNQIYFGNRAYGVAAAAQVYYGKTLDQLTLPELAMIAGLPKAPSAINPIANPVAAKQRRDHVLSRMLEHGYIDTKTYQTATEAPIATHYHGQNVEIQAPYVGEMVRDAVVKQYGDIVYRNGFKVYTTIDSRLQNAANEALKNGLIAYDHRHGYRRIRKNLGSPDKNQLGTWREILQTTPIFNGLKPATVVSMNENSVTALLSSGQMITIPWSTFTWTEAQLKNRDWIEKPSKPSTLYKPGDVIRVDTAGHNEWAIAQVPQVEGAIVSLNPQNGAITALVGGFDYLKSNFNRALQAERQPGSGFKPFVYAAALDKGYTLASVINDAPIVYTDSAGNVWRPQNHEHKFYGPTRLRVALAKSRNLVSIRLLEDIGIPYALKYISRFGFDTSKQPKELSLALGTGSTTPLDIVTGYAIFANGGYRTAPYLIDRLENAQGQTLYQAHPKIACMNCAAMEVDDPSAFDNDDEANNAFNETNGVKTEVKSKVPMTNTASDSVQYAPQAISPQTAFLMTSALQEVIKTGTGRAALSLNRNDLAGKTGTTDSQVDAWFTGYNSDQVATVWVGYDQNYPLNEYGAQAALPIWIDYMKIALQNQPEHKMAQPSGVVSAKIDPDSGLLARGENGIFEYFKSNSVPEQEATGEDQENADENGSEEGNEAVSPQQDQSNQEPLF